LEITWSPVFPVRITPSIKPVLVLVTDGVEATAQSPRDRGVPILAEPAESPFQPGHTAAAFQDSEGNQMMLVGR
jgi:predicted enzyme related to lactoylglutathione lyase